MGILILMVYTAEKNVLHKSLFAQQRIGQSKFQNVLKKLEINGTGSGYMRRDQIISTSEACLGLVS